MCRRLGLLITIIILAIFLGTIAYAVSSGGLGYRGPSSHASNGAVHHHMLRTASLVPEPSAILALLCGITALGGLITRRRRQHGVRFK